MIAAVPAGPAVVETPPGSRVRRLVHYATTADGVAHGFPLIVVAGRQAGPTVLFVAGIHGDEYEGPAALWQLANALDPETLVGRVLIVPVANPPAFAAGTRTSPVDGENLARIFPGNRDGTLSHQLAAALMESVVTEADVLIDSHSGGVRLAFMPVAGFYADGVDANAAVRSLEVAKQMGIVCLWQLPPVSGVLSFEAARQGIAICGAEIGGRGGCRPEDRDLYFAAYRSVLSHQGMIDAAHKRPLTRPCLEGDWVRTPRGGHLQTMVPLASTVTAGTLVAQLFDMFGDPIDEFRAGFDGRVMAVRHLNAVQPGDLATCVVRESTR